jgi:hypothetical protein
VFGEERAMAIRFVNDRVKVYLAKKGVPSVFG